MMYREKATGAILRADVERHKVAVYYDYPEHCGMPSWMTRAEFRSRFDRVTLCAQRTVENSRVVLSAACSAR